MQTGNPQRWDYTGSGLDEIDPAATPWQLARSWVTDAVDRQTAQGDLVEPLSMALATVDEHGNPDVREVLMRVFNARGPGFVTSTDSAKGAQLAVHPVAAASLTWPAMFRAIRFRGPVEAVARIDIEPYWISRPRGSQLAAYASRQSAPVASRAALEATFAEIEGRFAETDRVPMPPNWGAYRLLPSQVEFWAGRPDRLHDRLLFQRVGEGDLGDVAAWQCVRLQP